MSGGKEEESYFLDLGQSVHYLNPQMKFLSALLQAVYRLNKYQMGSRVWNDIRYTGSRTEDTPLLGIIYYLWRNFQWGHEI